MQAIAIPFPILLNPPAARRAPSTRSATSVRDP